MSLALFYLARKNNSNALQRDDLLPEDINWMHLELETFPILALMLMLLRMEISPKLVTMLMRIAALS